MPFTLKFTDPSKIQTVTVPDMPPGINTTDTDLNLLGRGYPNYGQKTAENFLHLLENFASPNQPNYPIQGQLWYDSSNKRLKINVVASEQGYTTATWVPAAGIWQQPIDPADPAAIVNPVQPGDVWVDTRNNILSIYTNIDTWATVGGTNPAYQSLPTTSTTASSVGTNILQVSTTTGIEPFQLVLGNGVPPETIVKSVIPGTNQIFLNKSFNSTTTVSGTYDFYTSITPSVTTGEFPTLLNDSENNLHWVIEHRIQDTTVAIDSYDSFHPNPPIDNFPYQINTGTTMINSGKFWGTSKSADGLNLYFGSQTYNLLASQFVVKDDAGARALPGPGQIVSGRFFVQTATDGSGGLILTSQDDPTGATLGKIQVKKSGNDLAITNDINYGNILLNTNILGGGTVKINSIVKSKSPETGALTVAGGMGVVGDLWVGGAVHANPGVIITEARNLYNGNPGQIPYQTTASTTGFITTGTTGSILVSQGAWIAPRFTNTTSIQVGFATTSGYTLSFNTSTFVAHASTADYINTLTTSTTQVGYSVNLLGGQPGQFVYQTNADTTAFINTGSMYVALSNTSTNLAGGSTGQYAVQLGPNTTGFIDPAAAKVSALLGGSTNSLIYQSAPDTTTFLNIGPQDYLLTSNGTSFGWAAPKGLQQHWVAVGAGPGNNLVGSNALIYDINGNLVCEGDVIAGSDRAIKENIETITGALDKVLALRGVSFNYKASGKPNIGLIAQEVQEILPMVVNTNESTGLLGVSYISIVGLLVEAIKELQAQVDELKNNSR